MKMLLGWLAATAVIAAASLPVEALPDFVEVPATVDAPAFYIARHEITVGQFGTFVRASGWPVDRRALAGASGDPVAFVSWPDALAYCRWLESALRSAPSPPYVQQLLRDGWRVTLPTEAEWERGVSGSGNVWEWTRSPYHAGLDADALWVIRRAADNSRLASADTRGGADPGARRPFISFRVVISRRSI
jgi:formylglycine-generating enzyme required for sulfatase activity